MSNSNLNPLVDGDILVYRVGFAVKDDEPLEYALATMRSVLNTIYDRFPESQYHKLYLSGKGNYREQLATLAVYKGNRDPSHRPHYYEELKQYMIDHHDAIVVDGQEADDAIVQEQWKNKDKSTVIVSIDKDLRTCPGFHYNPVKLVLDYVSLANANYSFFEQMLTGDRTDNIPGIKGVGPKTAEKMLAPCQKEVVKMKQVVMDQYNKQYGSDAWKYYKEISNLLWIRREEGVECPF